MFRYTGFPSRFSDGLEVPQMFIFTNRNTNSVHLIQFLYLTIEENEPELKKKKSSYLDLFHRINIIQKYCSKKKSFKYDLYQHVNMIIS